MSPAETKALVEQIRENLDKLDRCAGPHAFESLPNPGRSLLARRYRCANCEGEVDVTAHRWYQRGLAHGVATGRAT